MSHVRQKDENRFFTKGGVQKDEKDKLSLSINFSVCPPKYIKFHLSSNKFLMTPKKYLINKRERAAVSHEENLLRQIKCDFMMRNEQHFTHF